MTHCPPPRPARCPSSGSTETSMTPTRTTFDCAGARCSAKEPPPNEPAMRRLTRPCSNKTTAAANTKLARHAWVETGTASNGLATP